MYSICYTSTSLLDNQSHEYFKIFDKSSEYNLSNSITGILVAANNTFFQIIEGEEQEIKSLFSRIQQDKRHKQVVCLSRNKIEKRLFQKWSLITSHDKFLKENRAF